jgi:hypothetical protein
MSVAPGVYARNRMFALYAEPAVRRARSRAATIRGLVRQLLVARRDVSGLVVARSGARTLVRFRIERLHLERRVELTEVETACFVYLASRAGVHGIHATSEDRALLDSALRRLALGLEIDATDIDASGG